MNRRTFIRCLGIFAAAAYLPAAAKSIIRAPAWHVGRVLVYRTAAPLVAGNYTFTAGAGEHGMYFGGIKALGGETLFEIPYSDHPFDDPRLKHGGIFIPYDNHNFRDSAVREATLRGDAVTPENDNGN